MRHEDNLRVIANPAPEAHVTGIDWDNSEDPAVKLFVGFDVEGYVEEYELCGEGGDYSPNEQEKTLLVDAIYGVVSNLHEALRKIIPSAPAPQNRLITDEMVERAARAMCKEAGDVFDIVPSMHRSAARAALEAAFFPSPETREQVMESALRGLLESCRRSPVGGADGGTCIVYAPSGAAMNAAMKALKTAKAAAQADHDPHVLAAITTEGYTEAARDIKLLLAQIDYLQESFGEELSEEDAGIVLQIRETWAATSEGSEP